MRPLLHDAAGGLQGCNRDSCENETLMARAEAKHVARNRGKSESAAEGSVRTLSRATNQGLERQTHSECNRSRKRSPKANVQQRSSRIKANV
jgi:hypothetical protein